MIKTHRRHEMAANMRWLRTVSYTQRLPHCDDAVTWSEEVSCVGCRAHNQRKHECQHTNVSRRSLDSAMDASMDGSRLRRDGANQASKSLGYSVIYTCISGLLIVVCKQNFVSLLFP